MEHQETTTPPASENPRPAPEGFHLFLSHLAPQEEEAWEKYIHLHAKLSKFFQWKLPGRDSLGFADQTIDRAARHLQENRPIRNLQDYCFGVARFVFLEALRAPQFDPLDPAQSPVLNASGPEEEAILKQTQAIFHKCARHCLETLDPEERELYARYYHLAPSPDERAALAETLRLSAANLRQKVSRIRRRVESCVEECKRKETA